MYLETFARDEFTHKNG